MVRRQKTTEEQDEETTAELSQKLVDTLPKFFAKYQSDGVRMVEVLRLASHIDFQSYAEARLVSVSAVCSLSRGSRAIDLRD